MLSADPSKALTWGYFFFMYSTRLGFGSSANTSSQREEISFAITPVPAPTSRIMSSFWGESISKRMGRFFAYLLFLIQLTIRNVRSESDNKGAYLSPGIPPHLLNRLC